MEKLFHELGVRKSNATEALLRQLRILRGPAKYNLNWKPVLLKWGADCYFRRSHDTYLPVSARILLPIQHFRFAGNLYRKIATGLKEGAYYNNSADHRLLGELLSTMEAQDGSFLYRESKPLKSFADLSGTGNAFGL